MVSFSFFMTVAVYLLTLQGCTSIQWQDTSGTSHHLGILWYQVDSLAHGERLSRLTFGIDLRLAGYDRGVSIGFKRMQQIRPEVVLVENPADLVDQTKKYIELGCPRASRQKEVDTGSLFLSEDITTESIVLDSSTIGFEWGFGSVNPGISLGYLNSRHFLGVTLEEGSAQVYCAPGREGDGEGLILWKLGRLGSNSSL